MNCFQLREKQKIKAESHYSNNENENGNDAKRPILLIELLHTEYAPCSFNHLRGVHFLFFRSVIEACVTGLLNSMTV